MMETKSKERSLNSLSSPQTQIFRATQTITFAQMLNPLKNQVDLYLQEPFLIKRRHKNPLKDERKPGVFKVSLIFLATLQDTPSAAYFTERKDMKWQDLFKSVSKPWASEKGSIKKNSRSVDLANRITGFGERIENPNGLSFKISKYFEPLSLTNSNSSMKALENLLKYSLIDKKVAMMGSKNGAKKKISEMVGFMLDQYDLKKETPMLNKDNLFGNKQKMKILKKKSKKKKKKKKKKISLSKVGKKLAHSMAFKKNLIMSPKITGTGLQFGFLDNTVPNLENQKKSKLMVQWMGIYWDILGILWV